MSSFITAAVEVKEKGTFGYLDSAFTTPDLYSYLER